MKTIEKIVDVIFETGSEIIIDAVDEERAKNKNKPLGKIKKFLFKKKMKKYSKKVKVFVKKHEKAFIIGGIIVAIGAISYKIWGKDD